MTLALEAGTARGAAATTSMSDELREYGSGSGCSCPWSARSWAYIALAAAFLVPIAIYFVGVFAYVAVAHQERYITTQRTVIDTPASYAGVKIDFAYYYKKDENRLRVVVTLPEGYPLTAGNTVSDARLISAHNTLPAWAAHTDKRVSYDIGYSYSFNDVGEYAQLDDDFAVVVYMYVNNDVDTQGYWEIGPNDNTVDTTGNSYWLSSTFCAPDDGTKCLDHYIGELTFRFNAAVDRTAWGLKYDAAAL
jgi:hypothetical protein